MDDRIYWLWLQEALGPGSRIPMAVHREFPGGVQSFYRAGPTAWKRQKGVTGQSLQALSQVSLKDAYIKLAAAVRKGWQVLTPDTPAYPEALKNIYDPPAVLYVKGVWPDFSAAPAIGVVGARRAIRYSREAARRISRDLAQGGAILVSGIADGIDGSALPEALGAGGRVVSVLPVSLDSSYPMETAWLRRKILQQGGALVTEFLSQERPAANAFRLRNRLITGLCYGVVLIQAGERSGTVMYASRAAEQNREVYVVPGPPVPEFAGSVRLMEEGAAPVLSGEEVLRDCPAYYWGGR